MKENILSDAKKGGGDATNSSNETASPAINSSNETTSTTSNATNETTSVTNIDTTRSNYTYVYGVGILAFLAIGVCVFFVYFTFQPKKLINEKQDQQPKRRHML